MADNKIKINKVELTVRRLNLKGWTSLDTLRKLMMDAISKRDFTEYFSEAVRFVEVASISHSPIDWEKVSWYEFLEVYALVVETNKPTIDFPVLHGEASSEDEKLPWEYDGRSWYFWLNLFAKKYGWTENIIEELDIDTALGLFQETQIDDQFQKEWQWGLSEIAFPYNSSTKKQEYKPLERPSWMKPLIPKELPMIRIRRDMLPMGNIIDLSSKPVAKQEGISGI